MSVVLSSQGVDVPIAVVGGGIGGLTAALALHRKRLSCAVFEQAAVLGEVGAGVQVAPNASRVLRRLELANALAEVAVRPAALTLRRWDDDSPLALMRVSAPDAPYYTVHRADLHRVLVAALPAETVQLSSRCAAVHPDGDRVLIEFADGRTVTAGLVIGADGIHSTVRTALAEDQPRYSGQSVYRALIPADRVASTLSPDPAVNLWMGPEQHCVCYPVSGGRVLSFGATMPAADWQEESWTARGELADLLACYAGWSPQVLELLQAADAVSRWALHDRAPLASWVSNRIVLLGDAAHPMLPFLAQGVNQAIEDAATVAACLAEFADLDRSQLALPARRHQHHQRRDTTSLIKISQGRLSGSGAPARRCR
ncbi:FAD-dependent monooxygenase [Nocardia sp. NEAU-G5]|uniref:FAD-dependent monooxygenase n=1 Tax=Nocardia albiluteola TaxID=2842303 RepID=A0ABS6B2S6_9NOCA|nr:FAD-dependent monooxygenase [Nocardia albiluteola]MBU3064539.1 FAD-dependent monooxygenase [Nocardia albiluteola]